MRNRNTRIGFFLFGIYLLLYVGFVFLNAFAPETMEITPFAGEVLEEVFYRDYKDIKGIKTASKLLLKRDGKKFVESEMTEMEYVDALDDSLFEKP